MALPATAVWEVMTDSGVSDLNGGGWYSVAGGTNYAQTAGPHVAFDGATIKWTAAGAGLTIKIYGYTVAAADVGNCLRIPAGGDANATPGWYFIASVTTGAEGTQAWTLVGAANACTGAVTAGTGRMGGALASPGMLSTTLTINGQKAWVKAGTYTLTTDAAGTAGRVAIADGVRCTIEGWESTRGDLGASPVIDYGSVTNIAGVTNLTTNGSAEPLYVNIKLDGKSGVGNNGFANTGTAGRCRLLLCTAVNCNQATTNYGFTKYQCIGCLADACGVGFVSSASWPIFCTAKNCTADGFDADSFSYIIVAVGCVAYGNAGKGFKAGAGNQIYVACTSYGNTGDNFDTSAQDMCSFVNCHSDLGSAYGFDTKVNSLLVNCGHYATGGSGRSANSPHDYNAKSPSGEPMTGAADFRANATANAGVILRAGALVAPGQTASGDVGAVQHSDPAASGTAIFLD